VCRAHALAHTPHSGLIFLFYFYLFILWFCVQGKNAAKFEQYQLAEIKHSRLAMLAFSG
jgi:hypothetical protein